jgi:hypothetical protein
VVEQGLSFTVIEAPHPLDGDPEDFDARRDFSVARRVWLGWVPGTDWLHDAIESELGEDQVWYEVESKRDATHIGAAGEIATVALILMGAGAAEFARRAIGKIGERSGDALFDWVRDRARERRGEFGDQPPDFMREEDLDALAQGMTGELADVLAIPEKRLELVGWERREGLAMYAVYDDRESGRRYGAEVGRDNVTIRPLGEDDPVPSRKTLWKRLRP